MLGRSTAPGPRLKLRKAQAETGDIVDNGPIRASKTTQTVLAARAHWLTVEWLPKYAPELNDIEALWRDLNAHHLAHQTFADPESLDAVIHRAVTNPNRPKSPSVGIQRISA